MTHTLPYLQLQTSPQSHYMGWFEVKSTFGDKNSTKIYSEPVDYSGYILTEEDKKDYKKRVYAERKQELEGVRQSVIQYWNSYLEVS